MKDENKTPVTTIHFADLSFIFSLEEVWTFIYPIIDCCQKTGYSEIFAVMDMSKILYFLFLSSEHSQKNMLMYSKKEGVEQVNEYERLVKAIETGFSLKISNNLNRTGKSSLYSFAVPLNLGVAVMMILK